MEDIIKIENLTYKYQIGTPFEFEALKDISLCIKKGEKAAVIGPTGSGKSTLIQHMNGLLKPTLGRVLVAGRDINKKDTDKKAPPVCFQVGLVFQYPEYQLFEETVFDDIAFGPKNMKLPPSEIKVRVKASMEAMKLDYKSMKNRSPFSLSGGEMRRTALAGILAMNPSVLVLDEPAAGLDPRGREELWELLEGLHKDMGITLVLVSHEMEDTARMANHIIIINQGSIAADGTPSEIFKKHEWLEEIGLGIPPCMELMVKLNKRGASLKADTLLIDDAVEEILKHLKEI